MESISALKTKLATAQANIAVADEQMKNIAQEARTLGVAVTGSDDVLTVLGKVVEGLTHKIADEQQRLDDSVKAAQMLLAGSR